MRLVLLLLCLLATTVLVAGGCTDCKKCSDSSRVANPDFKKECGINIVVVLDESGSINQDGYIGVSRTAMKKFWNSLANILDVGGTVNMGVIEFGTTARFVSNTHTLDTTYLNKLDNYADGNNQDFSYIAGSPGGCSSCKYNPPWSAYTNWGGAMKMVHDTTWNHPIDIVVWFTDGEPTTTSGLDCDSECYDSCNYGCSRNKRGLWAGCTWANKVKAKGYKLFLVGVGGVDGHESKMQDVTGPTNWDEKISTFGKADYVFKSDFNQLGNLFAAVAVSLCPCAARLQQPLCQNVGSDYCDREVVFRSHIKISASKTTTQWPKQSVLTGIMYYNFATNEERMAFQFFDPADAGAISRQPQSTIMREDILNPCTNERKVFCSSQCFTATDAHIIPRLFRDAADTVGSGNCFYANAGCQASTTNIRCVKKATNIPALDGKQESVDIVMGIDTGNGNDFVICAARTRDGTVFEFFVNHLLVPGVTYGTLDANNAYQLKDPLTNTNYNFDKNTPVCPPAICNENQDIAFLMDEQNVISTTDWGSFWKDWMKSTIDHYDYAKNNLIRFGVAFGDGGYSGALQNAGGSVKIAIDAKSKGAGSTTNWASRIDQTIKNFWSLPDSNVYHAPRVLVLMVGGSNINGDSATLKALYLKWDVTVWAVGIGPNGGSTNAAGLLKLASDANHVLTFATGPLLSVDSNTMWNRLCPGNEKICGECEGFCNCLTCYCPLCVVTDACKPSECKDAQLGCKGQTVNCPITSKCSSPLCTDSNGELFPGGTAVCTEVDNSDSFIGENCVTTNKCAIVSCDAVIGCKYTKNTNVASICNDDNICTDDTCPYVVTSPPAPTGICVFTPIPFGPSNPTCGSKPCDTPCSTNKCLPAECFQSDSECVSRFTAPGDATILAACKAAVATTPFKYCHVTPVVCPTNTFCQTFTCVPATGLCPPTNKPIATVCDDSSLCTTDTCNLGTQACVFTPTATAAGCGTSDVCINRGCTASTGACFATPAKTCDDSSRCTTDTCDPKVTGGCVFTPTLTASGCGTSDVCINRGCTPATGACFSTPAKTCDDSNACTVDNCDAAANPTTGCVYKPTTVAAGCGTSDICINRGCTVATGVCFATSAQTCDDSDLCTTDTCDPKVTGGCVYTPKICDDSNSCTIDTCNVAGTCVYTPQSGGSGDCCLFPTDCADSNACTKDTCIDNTALCAALGADSAACTAAITSGNAGKSNHKLWCVNKVSVVCPINDVCTNYLCNAATGVCDATPAKTCDDSSLCTVDTCDAAANPTTGCVFTPTATANGCGTSDICINRGCTPATGACFATPAKTCDDSSLCTTDTCDTKVIGGCVFTPTVTAASCGTSNVCRNKGCTAATGVCFDVSAKTCDDSSLCTTDTCDPNVVGGCVYTNTIAANGCGTSDVCTNRGCTAATGVCFATPAKTCNDGSHCTTDSCNPAVTGGCVYTNAVSTITQLNSVCSPFVGACDLSCRTCTCTPTSCTIVIDTTTQPICDKRDLCPSTYSCPAPANKCQFARCISHLTNCAGSDNNAACLAHINNASNTRGYCSADQPTALSQTCVSNACFNIVCNTGTGICDSTPTAFANGCNTADPCNPGACALSPTRCEPDPLRKVVCEQPNKCQTVSCVNNAGKAECSNVVNITCQAPTYNVSGVSYIDNCKTVKCDVNLGCVQPDIPCPDDLEKCIRTLGCVRNAHDASIKGGCQQQTITSLIDFCGKCKGGNVGCFLSNIPYVNAGGIAAGIIAGVVVAAVIAAALAVFGGKKGYEYYQSLSENNMANVDDNPLYKEGQSTGEMLNSDIH